MICLDSDCIIDFLKGRPEAVRAVESFQDSIITTEINRFEVLFGIYAKKSFRPEELLAANQLLESLDVMPFENGCGALAAKSLASLARRGGVIGQNDALIAATILNGGCQEIITRNVKHFSKIDGIRVRAY